MKRKLNRLLTLLQICLIAFSVICLLISVYNFKKEQSLGKYDALFVNAACSALQKENIPAANIDPFTIKTNEGMQRTAVLATLNDRGDCSVYFVHNGKTLHQHMEKLITT